MIDIPAWLVFITAVFLAIVVGRTGTIVKDYFENHNTQHKPKHKLKH